MDEKSDFVTTTFVTISTTNEDGQTVLERWPVTKTDYRALLDSPTALPVRLTIPFDRPFTHDDLLEASGLVYWNWLDEPADGLVFSAFHQRGNLPQIIIRYFDETHSLVIAGADENQVNQVKLQLLEVVAYLEKYA
jgi:hypothetical protein